MKTCAQELPAARACCEGELMFRFSIVTVCRNAERVIASSGLSLRHQTYHDYEWLVIDGASTDNTLEVIAGLGVQSSRIISEPDLGVYDAMNKAVSLACGEWIYFLNAGDAFIDEAVLADVAAGIDAHPTTELLWGDMIYFGRSGEWLRRYRHVGSSMLVFEDLNHQAVFAARALFERLGRFNLRFRTSADYDWLLRVFRAGTTTHYIQRVIARFEVGGYHSTNPAATVAERSALRLQYVTPRTLRLGLQLARVRRRWRIAIGHGG
jgi:glycosyltransferase involved in cell wall biosynthesis